MNQFIPKEILHFMQPSEKTEDIAPEEKKDDELSNEDRMYLMNKKIDHQIISSIYQNLSDKKNLMYNEHQSTCTAFIHCSYLDGLVEHRFTFLVARWCIRNSFWFLN